MVGRPNWQTPLFGLAGGMAACAATVVLAMGVAPTQPSIAVTLVFVGMLAVVFAARRLPALRDAIARVISGTGFAIADDEILLVDDSGRAVLVAVECITELVLAGSEPRLKTDSDAQGLIYATLFAVFDETGSGPNPERFFEALAPRVRARCPRALVSRRDACDDPLLVG